MCGMEGCWAGQGPDVAGALRPDLEHLPVRLLLVDHRGNAYPGKPIAPSGQFR